MPVRRFDDQGRRSVPHRESGSLFGDVPNLHNHLRGRTIVIIAIRGTGTSNVILQ